MNNIGKRIRDLRKKNDLTKEKMAGYLNVSYQAVSKWENGVNTPDLNLIVPLAKILHTTTDELL
ncbi:MAG: helix-turn-helix transcriptional regulator, partial [Clostridia bacterium]|nr:helix-turn-helix transcriptional regulator [Clostridia bacterium]